MTLTFKVVDGDIPHGAATGRPLTVESVDKFSQDIRMTLDDDVQPDGTRAGLDGMVGFIGDAFATRAILSRRIIDACTAFRAAQEAVQRFDRAAEERFSRVALVQVFPLRDTGTGAISNTNFAYRADFLSQKGGRPTSVTGVLTR